jgi:arylsulfatase A-like enzyme
MHRFTKLLWAFFVICWTIAGAAATNRPNVIVIFADDLGWSDLGVAGGHQVKTPNLDRLATNGVRFTSGYVTAPLCSPSRAGLMTGRYQQRFGHETNPGETLELAPEFGLPLTESTIANRMKPLGYATGWIGKSHLGAVTNLYHPKLRGFDEFWGFLEGAHSYTVLCATNDPDPVLDGYARTCPVTNYLTAAFAQQITNFIARHAGESFFLYAPFNAVHTPHAAPPELLARFPTNEVPDPGRRMMLAVLAGLDDAVGLIRTQLMALNLATNTLIFFSADNGGFPPHNYSSNAPLRGMKTQCYEGGIRVPYLVEWPGVIPGNQIIPTPVSTLDILPTAVAAAGGITPPAWQLDGVNLLPLMTGQAAALPRTNLFWRIETDGQGAEEEGSKDGVRAVRSGDWKLIKAGVNDPWELYDLADDISESVNLADARPEVVQRLLGEFDAWAAQLAVPRWAYNKLAYARPAFVPEDVRIGATNVSYAAAEFLHGGAHVAFLDGQSNLWRGAVDLDSGFLASGHGQDLLVDTGLAPLASAVTAPQWGLSTNGPALFYTKPGTSNRLQIWRARITGNVPAAAQLTTATVNDRFGVQPGQWPGASSVKLAYNSGGAAVWADEHSAPAAALLIEASGGAANGHWLPSESDFAYARLPQFQNYEQVARFRTANGVAQTLTAEFTHKTEVWGFLAPEFNNELCYAAIVDRTGIGIYRDLHDNTNGFFTRVATLAPPTNTAQRHLYSMQPVAGLRGFNGTSWFTAAAFENDNPQNPGDSGIWIFGFGGATNGVMARRLDAGAGSTNRFAGRREPRTVMGTRELFCHYLSDDGVDPVQLRMATTGLRLPDALPPASGFAALRFTRSFTPGSNDVSGRLMSGTEVRQLVAHDGRLYAGTGSRRFDPYPTDTNSISTNWTGAQILVQDAPGGCWRVDELTPDIFRVHLQVDALASIKFTTRANGQALSNAVNLLVAGLTDIGTNGATIASVRTRLPGSPTGWEHSTVVTSTAPANVLAFGSHVDLSTGVHLAFAGLENGEIYRGVLNTNAPGLISWLSGSRELAGGGPVTAFAECNHLLYAVSGLLQTNTNSAVAGGLHIRADNSNGWLRVYQWSAPADVSSAPQDHRLALGLTSVRDPLGGDKEVLLLARAWPGVIERVDPTNNHAVTVELDVRDFFARRWQDDRVRSASVTLGYTGFFAVTNPVTGEPFTLVGVWLEHPDTNAPSFRGTHFLVRHADGTYELADVGNDVPSGSLRATRCIAASPFAGDLGGVFYFGGYDTGDESSTNTAWILRGDWTAWPRLDIASRGSAGFELNWPLAGTNWMLQSATNLSPPVIWQTVDGMPARSLTNESQAVFATPSGAFFRLRRP